MKPDKLRSLWFDSDEEAVAAEEQLRHSKQKWGGGCLDEGSALNARC
ncbi:MAG: hypothetical protein Q7U57_15160 [Methylovulum sp.]|nr:hypothetical protein [Methylovulum sp.]